MSKNVCTIPILVNDQYNNLRSKIKLDIDRAYNNYIKKIDENIKHENFLAINK